MHDGLGITRAQVSLQLIDRQRAQAWRADGYSAVALGRGLTSTHCSRQLGGSQVGAK
jgi:hypothetical protein